MSRPRVTIRMIDGHEFTVDLGEDISLEVEGVVALQFATHNREPAQRADP